jgi:hypothetical protein
MVNIDTVYQRVLAIANKEQRGYITPLEFNLMANQAQLDVFEQYFYDKNQNERLLGNDTDYSDIGDILNEKISMFETFGNVGGGTTLPNDLYRLNIINVDALADGNIREAEYVDHKDWVYLRHSPLTAATNDRPVYTRDSGGVFVIAANNAQIFGGVTCNYVRQPNKVEWGYDVINEMALYQPATSTDFEHHSSDETELVMKILELAGVIMNKPGLAQIAGTEDLQKIQQEKQ